MSNCSLGNLAAGNQLIYIYWLADKKEIDREIERKREVLELTKLFKITSIRFLETLVSLIMRHRIYIERKKMKKTCELIFM